ncbi:MAG: ligase-associated DNA damage response endonuclease PdeM [Planctomycetota bacterium]|nr:ligase-associated DNA damage response endonuclease PdeM [Planctomycetota bacterium]
MNEIAVELSGEEVLLSSDRALYWPRERKLFVADAHFGKAAAFRARGVPVPHGTTEDNFARLDTLLVRFTPRALVFLGDFLHARESRGERMTAALSAWRARHPLLDVLLIRGNHDARAGDPPAELRFVTLNAPHVEGPFEYCHHSGERERGYGIVGHLHPSFVLQGRARQSVRLPCFWMRKTHVVLPAFGAFTGTMAIERESGDRVFLAARERIFEA